jgi:GNAT superfamily N-acetyltransferase
VARYDRMIGTDDAEIAFVVADDWQRRGIASALFPKLQAHAVKNGATCLVAETLAENRGMRKVFMQSGSAERPTWDHGVAQTRMPIAGTEDRD